MTMSECSVLCIGELVWDLFPDGARMGGAPFNVAVHLARQGVKVALLTSVGRDELGTSSLAFLEKEGIPGALIHPRLPTGTVKVELDPEGIPHFAIHDQCAWTDVLGAFPPGIPVGDSLDLSKLSAIVFGGLAMHSPANRLLFSNLVSEFQTRGIPLPLRLCDLNLRPDWADPEVVRWCANQADILKVNEEEHQFLECLESGSGEVTDQLLLSRYTLQGICTTMGPRGLRWADHLGEAFPLPAWIGIGAPPVIDTVGAGDAITASIATGLCRKESADVFLDRGRRWAAMICGVPGALPPSRIPHDLAPSGGPRTLKGVGKV